jgi:hypothetical protein
MSRAAKKSDRSKTTKIPQRIQSGKEPLAERYTGNWKPVEMHQQPATDKDLEDVTNDMDKGLLPELFPGESEEVTTSASATKPMNWKSTQRDLAATFDSLRSAGKIDARNEADMIRQIVKHFVHNGNPMNENSLRINLQQQRDQLAGRKK